MDLSYKPWMTCGTNYAVEKDGTVHEITVWANKCEVWFTTRYDKAHLMNIDTFLKQKAA